MGKLQTAVGLPKKILLQGWAGDQGDNDINGEYTFYYESYLGIGTVTPIQNVYINLNKIASNGVVDSQNISRPAIAFYISSWIHKSDDIGWNNSSSNPNVLPLNGWIESNAQGPAGTITILENISVKNNKVSIKKQNLGGGRLLSPKLNQRIIPYFIIIQSDLAYYDNGNSVTVSAGASIRFFTNSTTSGLNTIVDASGNIVIGFSSTFIDLSYPNSGTYFITLTQPGDAFYKSATLTLTITVTVLAALVGSGSSGVGIGGGGV